MDLPLSGTEPVDDILDAYPMAGLWLSRQGVVCVQCGEVFWGSLKDLCECKKIKGREFDRLLNDFNAYLHHDEGNGN